MNGALLLRWALETTRALLAATVVIGILGFAGQASYEAAIERWTEEKLRTAQARQRHLAHAPIWSARCERRGMDSLAVRSDTGPWTVRCVERRVLQVPPTAPAHVEASL